VSFIAGSSQVRWNPLSSHTLATAHDGDVKIWDQRKATSPVQYITAHLTKVHSFVLQIYSLIRVIFVKKCQSQILDTWFRLVSFSTKSIGNIESRLYRQDLRYCKSAQGWKYFNDKFSCMESKIHSKNTDMKVFIIATSYDALFENFFTALWRGFSDDSGTAITTWRK